MMRKHHLELLESAWWAHDLMDGGSGTTILGTAAVEAVKAQPAEKANAQFK